MPEEAIDFELAVEPDDVRAFAVAVGEDNPVLFDAVEARRQGLPGPVAPPTFTVTQARVVPPAERERRLGAGLDPRRILHAEQEFTYRRLPLVGETLRGRMRITRDVTKEGRRGGTLRFVTYESRFTDDGGEEVLTSSYTLVQTGRDPRA
jgi:acyl dehydratase